MGSYCSTPETQNRIEQLEQKLLIQDEKKKEMEQKIEEMKVDQKEFEENETKINDEINKLKNEKKQTFKSMLQEQKKVKTLQVDVDDKKQQVTQLNKDFEQLKMDKIKKEKAKSQKKFSILAKYGINHTVSPKVKRNKSNKSSKSDDDDNNNNNDDQKQITKPKTVRQSTDILDIKANLDPMRDAKKIRIMLNKTIDTKPKKKALKGEIADLLTARSEGFRQQLIDCYWQHCKGDLEKDVLNLIGKGHTMDIISSLLMSSAEMDATIISGFTHNWNVQSCADIICCRTQDQLEDLYRAYKTKCKLDIKNQLKGLAKQKKKDTLAKVIDNMFNFDNNQQSDVLDNVVISSQVQFLINTKSFKKQNKEKLAIIFTCSTNEHLVALNAEYKSKAKSKNDLSSFVDKKLNGSSSTAYYCKRRIKYALDPPDYFARKIKKLGTNFRTNQRRIGEIFIQRLEVDLYAIKRKWVMKKYGDGNRSLKDWVVWKTKNSKSGYFLQKMLDNCERYAEFNMQQAKSVRSSKNAGINKLM